jgi:hypothetical protein
MINQVFRCEGSADIQSGLPSTKPKGLDRQVCRIICSMVNYGNRGVLLYGEDFNADAKVHQQTYVR